MITLAAKTHTALQTELAAWYAGDRRATVATQFTEYTLESALENFTAEAFDAIAAPLIEAGVDVDSINLMHWAHALATREASELNTAPSSFGILGA